MDLITNTIIIYTHHTSNRTSQLCDPIQFVPLSFSYYHNFIMNCIAELPVRYALLQALSNLNPI